MLLNADASEAGEGWSDSQIATALDVSIGTVTRTRQQLVEERLGSVPTHKHSPASARKRIFDGAAEAKLVTVDRSKPPTGTEYVSPGDRPGKPLVSLRKTWERVCKVAKIDALRLHDLRHSYASVGAADGLSLPVIGALLGHSQPSTTARYAHLAASPLHAAVGLSRPTPPGSAHRPRPWRSPSRRDRKPAGDRHPCDPNCPAMGRLARISPAGWASAPSMAAGWNCRASSAARRAWLQAPQSAARPPQAAETAPGSARPSRLGSVG
jgi:hypothetical protein